MRNSGRAPLAITDYDDAFRRYVFFLQVSEQYTALLVLDGKNFPQYRQARIMVRAINVSLVRSNVVCDGTGLRAKERDRFEAVS